MNADHWKSMVVLQPGQSLEHAGHRTRGFMEEKDIDTYAVLAADGTKIGSVTVNNHTAVNGFRRTIRVRQVDQSGMVILDKNYKVG